MLHELGVTQGWNFSVLSELELLGYHFGLLWVTFLKSFLCSFPLKFFLLLLKCDKDTKIPKIILQLCCLFFFFSPCFLFYLFIFFNSRGKISISLWEIQTLPWIFFRFFLFWLSRHLLHNVQDFHHSLWRGEEHGNSKTLPIWTERACKSKNNLLKLNILLMFLKNIFN